MYSSGAAAFALVASALFCRATPSAALPRPYQVKVLCPAAVFRQTGNENRCSSGLRVRPPPSPDGIDEKQTVPSVYQYLQQAQLKRVKARKEACWYTAQRVEGRKPQALQLPRAQTPVLLRLSRGTPSPYWSARRAASGIKTEHYTLRLSVSVVVQDSRLSRFLCSQLARKSAQSRCSMHIVARFWQREIARRSGRMRQGA